MPIQRRKLASKTSATSKILGLAKDNYKPLLDLEIVLAWEPETKICQVFEPHQLRHSNNLHHCLAE